MAILAVLLRLGCGGSAPPVPVAGAPAAPPAPAPAAVAPPDVPPASAPAVSAPPRPQALRLLVTVQQDGELEPCGCAEGQYGGLPRRASLLRAWEAQGVRTLLADNGDLILDASLQSQQKFETTLQAHQAMGTVALNLGEMDLLLDPVMVELTALNFETPYVSANVSPAAHTHVVVPVDVNGTVITVGITGFLDPELVTEAAPGWQVRAPRPALREVLATLAQEVDVILVLAHANRLRTEAILDGLPPPHAVVLAHEAEDPIEPVPTSLRGVPALAPGTQAKYLARFDVRTSDGRVQVVPQYEGLHERIPDLPALRALLDGYQMILEQLDIPDLTPRRPYAAGGSYVGVEACAACHVNAVDTWRESKHAHAMDIIVERKHEFDPDCLKCHTTGFTFVGGYRSRADTPTLSFVSCEACHGPGSNHAADPGPGYGHVETPTFCLTCHDTPNSPSFDFAEYWPKIQHTLDWEAAPGS